MTTFLGGPGCPDCGTSEHLEFWGYTPAHVVEENRPSLQGARWVNVSVEPHIEGYRCRQCGREFAGIDVPREDWPPEGVAEVQRP